jgi:hypothetical protein
LLVPHNTCVTERVSDSTAHVNQITSTTAKSSSHWHTGNVHDEHQNRERDDQKLCQKRKGEAQGLIPVPSRNRKRVKHKRAFRRQFAFIEPSQLIRRAFTPKRFRCTAKTPL